MIPVRHGLAGVHLVGRVTDESGDEEIRVQLRDRTEQAYRLSLLLFVSRRSLGLDSRGRVE